MTHDQSSSGGRGSTSTSRAWRWIWLLGAVVSAVYPFLLSGARPGRDLPATYGGEDPLLQAAILQHTLHHWPLRAASWHAPFLWPGRWSLAYMDPLLGQALLVAWIPGVSGSPAWAYTLAMGLTLALAFATAVQLARRLGLSAAVATLAGLAYSMSPYAVGHLQHLNQVPSPWLPLALTGLLDLTRGQKRGVAWLGIALFAQLVSGLYYTVAVLLTLGLVLPWVASDLDRHAWLGLAVLGMGFGLAAWVWSLPYRDAGAELAGFQRTAAQVGPFAARPFDLVHGPRPHLLPWPRFVPGRPALYPGVGWSLLALAGLASVGWTGGGRARALSAPARRAVVGLLVASVVGLVLSFGRSLPWPGRETEIPMPLAWLQDHVWPLRALRSPSRLFLPATLALALLGAEGTAALLRRARSPAVRGVAWIAVVVAVLDLAPGGTGRVRAALDGAERGLVAHLAQLPRPSPWVVFPQPCTEQDESELDARSMLWAVLSEQPVAGGSSGFVPAEVRQLRALCCAGPGPACLDELRRLGVTRLLVRDAVAPPPTSARLEWANGAGRLYVLKPDTLED